MGYQEDARQTIDLFMNRLREMEAVEYGILADEWRKIADQLQADIEKLSRGKYPTLDKLFRSTSWENFRRRALLLTNQYAEISAGVISEGQYAFASAGLQSSQLALGVFGVEFRTLNVDAANLMIGATQDGSPLYDVLVKRYGEKLDAVADKLVYATARGINPLETARLIGADMEGNFYNTVRIARTEQINIFRNLQNQQYVESGIVKGIEVIAEPDACPICQAEVASNPHPLGYVLDTHPNCRCGTAPLV